MVHELKYVEYLDSFVKTYGINEKSLPSHSQFEKDYVLRRESYLIMAKDICTMLSDIRIDRIDDIRLKTVITRVFALQTALDIYNAELKESRRDDKIDGIEAYLRIIVNYINEVFEFGYDLEREEIKVRYPELSEESMIERIDNAHITIDLNLEGKEKPGFLRKWF